MKTFVQYTDITHICTYAWSMNETTVFGYLACCKLLSSPVKRII